MVNHCFQLQKHIFFLNEALHKARSWSYGAEAHCTLAHRKLDDTQERLVNANAKKSRGSTKITSKARFITGPDLVEQFEADERGTKKRKRKRKRLSVPKKSRQMTGIKGSQKPLHQEFPSRLKHTNLKKI